MADKYYSFDDLLDTFEIKKVKKCDSLKKWISAKFELNKHDLLLLEEKRQLFELEGNHWNEEELKMRFLAILFQIAKIDEFEKIKVFFERSLSAQIEEHYLSVKCDCLIATPKGLNTPKNPYFFLQEFKKSKGDKLDPEAQMLTAMVIAQNLNNNNQPIFGGFVIGGDFYFSTLIGKKYCLSRLFNAANKSDLHQIIFILKNLKNMILKNLD